MTMFDEINELTNLESNFITNSSNFSAYIFENFSDINWVGFYMISDGDLLLSTFQGKPACLRIKLGKGVCGNAAQKLETIVVDDVHKFPGHIACDSASESELVIPIIQNGKLYGVLDIDTPIKSRFSHEDVQIFSKLIEIVIKNSDLDKIYDYYNK